jgi:D-serine deaminase-like pyridoxal phosphate-dependent protein
VGDTPHLRLDVAVAQANIDAMGAHAARLGVALRPHAKTHKSVELASRQLAAGAVGLTVATIGEAEVFAAAGATDLFIAYPLWPDAEALGRLHRLAGKVRLGIGCDSAEAGRRLAGVPAELLVEVDSGHHRSGVAPSAAGRLAAELAGLGHEVGGVFTFPGHAYAPGARQTAAMDEAAALRTAAAGLVAQGLAAGRTSGGSTPSAEFADPAVVDELRPGVYVFGDAQQLELGTITAGQVALTVVATVVSHAGGRVVADAGSKALGADRAPWASGHGRLLDAPDARLVALSEHHVTIEWPGRLPALGSHLLVVPNHVCNAVNLADHYVLSTGGTWPVDARGRNS